MIHHVDTNKSPLLVIWEVTRACSLACQHCRASAIDIRHPDELNTEEGKALLDDIAALGTPIVIFSGGDPLQREDLCELIQYAKTKGLRTGTIPAATDRLTPLAIRKLANAGLDQMAVSVDGATAASHDTLRGIPGAYQWALEGCRLAKRNAIPLQINTVLGAWNIHELDRLIEWVRQQQIVFWEVFFLVPTGRGNELQGCSPKETEEAFAKLWKLQQRGEFIVKVTEAPHYRRYIRQQQVKGDIAPKTAKHGRGLTVTRGGINAGKGFCFIDHTGMMMPSGFLPIGCGNVRHQSLIEIYREHPVFKALRDPDRLEGACGKCVYRKLCGGSRARAYALSGNMFAEDPTCILSQIVQSA